MPRTRIPSNGRIDFSRGYLNSYRSTALAAAQHWTAVAALTDVASGFDDPLRLGYPKTFLHVYSVRVVAMQSSATDESQDPVDKLNGVMTASLSARIYGKLKMGLTMRKAMAALTGGVSE